MHSDVTVVRDAALADFDFGTGHPMDPVRLRLADALAEASGLFAGVFPSAERGSGAADGGPLVSAGPVSRVRTVCAPIADRALLETVHDPEYVDAVVAVSGPDALALPVDPDRPDAVARSLGAVVRRPADVEARFGLGTRDVPVFPGLHEASARQVGGTAACVDAIVGGDSRIAVNVAGGMHHAMAAHAAGFCVYNDAAIGIRRALDAGVDRIVYLDFDVHHGDGVERAFWDDPRVTTVSIHESGQSLFPGTGFVQDLGSAGAHGEAVNVPLPRGTGGAAWLRAVEAIVPALVEAIKPDLLVTQHGCDSHPDDPLGHLKIPIVAQRRAMLLARDLAESVCGGHWLALGGGGYATRSVVPRVWTHLLAVAMGSPIAPEDPAPAVAGLENPWGGEATYGDHMEAADPAPWKDGFNPEDEVDRVIQSVRHAVFPLQGLDPWYD